jgi:hypothetical protein
VNQGTNEHWPLSEARIGQPLPSDRIRDTSQETGCVFRLGATRARDLAESLTNRVGSQMHLCYQSCVCWRRSYDRFFLKTSSASVLRKDRYRVVGLRFPYLSLMVPY